MTRPPSPYVADELSAKAAFDRRLPELIAANEQDLLQVNLDIPSVLATVLGALPAVRAVRPELERLLPSFDFNALDALEDYALALDHVHGQCLAASRPKRFRSGLIEEARILRARLLSCLKACAVSGVVDAGCLARVRGTAGNKDLATDLTLLVSVFRNHPALFAVQMLVTSQDIERSTRLTTEILASVGRRELSPEEAQRAISLRTRAFTLVVCTYGELRRALLLLRRKEADTQIPSLYRGRSKPKPRAASTPTDFSELKPATAPTAEPLQPANPWTDETVLGVREAKSAVARHESASLTQSEKKTPAVRIRGTGRRKRPTRYMRGPFRGAAGDRADLSVPQGTAGATPSLDSFEQAQTTGEFQMATTDQNLTSNPGLTADSTTSVSAPAPAVPAAANATDNATPADSVNQEASPGEILKSLLPEFLALPPDDLIQVNVDIPTAVSVILGALPAIRSYREAITKSMTGVDLVTFDKLENYGIALNEAHGNYMAATQPVDDLDALLEEGVRLREVLFSDANALSVRGLVDGSKLLELKGPIGHKNLASDLNLLSKVFEASWPQIQGKTAVTAAEVERANKLNIRIIRVVGLRDQNRMAVAAATDIRVRAFTVFTRAYDGVRRIMRFLRWNEGDFDRIAPSLFTNRTAPRRKDNSGPSDGPPSPPTNNPGAPPNTNGGHPSNTTATQQAPHATGAASGGDHSEPGGGVGTPGSDPFINS